MSSGPTADPTSKRHAADTALDVLESMGDAFCSLDAQFRYVHANSKHCNLGGIRLADVVGHSIWELYPEATNPDSRYWVELHRAMEMRITTHFLEYYPPRDVWTDTTVYPTPDGGLAIFIRDVSEQKRAEEALEQNRIYLTSLIDSIPHMVWVADARGKLKTCNLKLTDYSGMTFDKLVGDGWSSLLHPDDFANTLINWRASVAAGTPYNGEGRLLRHDGVYRWFMFRGSLYRDAEQEVLWFGTNTDIHERRMQSEELSRSNTELARFAFVASHDLKEPLRTVTNYTQLISKRYRGKLDETADLFIGFITQGVNRMYQLIDALLQYSKVGAEKPEFSGVDLDQVVNTALANLSQSITESHAQIKREVLPKVWADPSQLLQLFQNLISNAIKYRDDTRAPQIKISSRNTGDAWELSVEDDGIGIAAESQEIIFELFQRLNPKDALSGTGIGLAVCKRVAEGHGGKLWVESLPGKGSRFIFSLPQPR